MTTSHDALYEKLRRGASNGKEWHAFYVTADGRKHRYYAALTPDAVIAFPASQEDYGGKGDISSQYPEDSYAVSHGGEVYRAAYAVVKDMASAFGL